MRQMVNRDYPYIDVTIGDECTVERCGRCKGTQVNRGASEMLVAVLSGNFVEKHKECGIDESLDIGCIGGGTVRRFHSVSS